MNALLKFAFCGTLVCLYSCIDSQGQKITLAVHGTSSYQIVLASPDNLIVRKAGGDLQKYFKQATGIALPIESKRSPGEYQIWIGTEEDIQHVFPKWKNRKLGNDGYTIFGKDHNIIIAGGKKNGALFGVYTFLENYLGCRMYAPSVFLIPKQKSISIPSPDLTEIPSLIFRDVFYHPALNEQYAEWHKLTPAKTSYSSSWGTWAHTSLELVPPSRNFKPHPEYYALVNNKRQASQLDYTNLDVYEVILGALKAKIKNQPQYQYWSVSQEDNNHYCQCANCNRVYQETGSPSGTIVRLANKVAENFPDKTISTLAYSYSRTPPQNVKMAANLNILLCTDIRKYVSAYDAGPSHQAMRKALDGWLKLTSNIFIWDYVIDFSALESIYPNLLKLKSSLAYFVKKGIKGYFAQGDYYPGGEFAELRTYLLAKLLWNPDANDSTIIQDFLQGFYGKDAAPFLWKYIQLIDNQLTGGPNKLTESEANQYYALFQQAENASKKEKVFLERVQKEKMALDYSTIQLYLREAKANPRAFFKNDHSYKAFNAATDRFLKGLVQAKTTRLIHAEHNIPLYQFISRWKNQMEALRKK